MMSKEYRDEEKRLGGQARHKGRHVHQLDNVLSLAELRDEIMRMCRGVI